VDLSLLPACSNEFLLAQSEVNSNIAPNPKRKGSQIRKSKSSSVRGILDSSHSEQPVSSNKRTRVVEASEESVPAVAFQKHADVIAQLEMEFAEKHPDYDPNDPSNTEHPPSASAPTKSSKSASKKVFENKQQRNEVLQSYADEHINSDKDKGKPSTFNLGKRSINHLTLPPSKKTSHKKPFNSKRHPKLVQPMVPHPSELRRAGTFGGRSHNQVDER
jgi:hypothetical protein